MRTIVKSPKTNWDILRTKIWKQKKKKFNSKLKSYIVICTINKVPTKI